MVVVTPAGSTIWLTLPARSNAACVVRPLGDVVAVGSASV